MKKRRCIAIACIVGALSLCGWMYYAFLMQNCEPGPTFANFQRLRIDMEESEVNEILGEPIEHGRHTGSKFALWESGGSIIHMRYMPTQFDENSRWVARRATFHAMDGQKFELRQPKDNIIASVRLWISRRTKSQ